MTRKTVWIVGGLVVAIAAVAYLSYHTAPAGKDTAGTIVEAKRALSDGASNPATPSDTTGDRSADSDAVGRESTGGGRENATGGGRENATGGGRENATGGGRENATGGGRENATGGGRENATGHE